jgi:hypothetical protein
MGNVFNWKFYVDNYPDLQKAGINTQAKALRHWTFFGKKEGRFCCPPEPPNYEDIFTEPVPEPVVEVAEPVAEPEVVGPVSEPEPVFEPVVEVVEPVVELVAEPEVVGPEPVVEVAEPDAVVEVAEPVVEPVAEPEVIEPEPVVEVAEPEPDAVVEVAEPESEPVVEVPEPEVTEPEDTEIVSESEELVLDVDSGLIENKKPKRGRKKKI